MIIYLDVLFILNVFIDYFLLLGCSVLLKLNVKKKRIILGALVGGFFSLVIVFPEINVLLNFFIKIFSALLLILITFGFKKKQLFTKIFIVFFVENMVFVGVMFFVWVFVSPPGMFWKNGVTYVAISPVILLIGSLISYLMICIFNWLMSKRVDNKKIYRVEVGFNGKKQFLNALYDSGNCLTEPFTGKPVCVCEYDKIFSVFSEELLKFFDDYFENVKEITNSSFKKIIKLIPCDTISGFLVLPAFLPQNFYILNFNGDKKSYDCYVAVTKRKMSDGEYDAIIGDFN